METFNTIVICVILIVIHRANAATTEIPHVCAMSAKALMTAVVIADIAIAISNNH